eukprot:11940322-Alexandrium_andersonii.AAC.1
MGSAQRYDAAQNILAANLMSNPCRHAPFNVSRIDGIRDHFLREPAPYFPGDCLLYTSDAADDM